MLALSRKVNESVYCGDDLRVTVLAFHDGRVRLGFESLSRVPIWREELIRESHADMIAAFPPYPPKLGATDGR